MASKVGENNSVFGILGEHYNAAIKIISHEET